MSHHPSARREGIEGRNGSASDSARVRATADRRKQRGASMVFVAVGALVLVGFVGLALDTGWVYHTAQQLQIAGDAAALAAAAQVKFDSESTQFSATRLAATTTAGSNTAAKISVAIDENYANDPDGDVVVGHWDGSSAQFVPDTISPDAVKVHARFTQGSIVGPLVLFFGEIFGKPTSNVSRTSIAQVGPTPNPLILVLHLTKKGAMRLRGTSLTDASKGRVHVNSNHACGVEMDGGPTLLSKETEVVGHACLGNGTFTGLLSEEDVVLPDPLASLPYPSFNPSQNLGTIAGAGTYQPGYYAGGINMNGGIATLNAGIFVLGGPGIELHGTGSVVDNGAGVMLFVLQGSPNVDISGSGCGMTLSAPSSGTYQGVVLFQHRQNAKQLDIGGGGNFDLKGLIYTANGHVSMDGTPGKKIGALICNTVEVRGTSGYIFTGEGVPPPSGPDYVYLVQ